MPVSNFNVFCFRTFKKPFFSSIWYCLLFYTIWNPSDTLPTVLGIIFLAFSFTRISCFLGLFSIVPCIAEMIICHNYFNNAIPVIVIICGLLWIVLWYFGVCVWRNIVKGVYVYDPNTRFLFRNINM